jgi:hypothetical protein
MGFLENKEEKIILTAYEHCIWVKTHFGKLLWNNTFPKG